jgi:hypothetical protein
MPLRRAGTVPNAALRYDPGVAHAAKSGGAAQHPGNAAQTCEGIEIKGMLKAVFSGAKEGEMK